MTSPAEQPAPPPRTWRPMAAWTAGIVGALAIIWLVAVACLWFRETRSAVLDSKDAISKRIDARHLIDRLGGPGPALRKLRLYTHLPHRIAPYQGEAVCLAFHCGDQAVPFLKSILADKGWNAHVNADDWNVHLSAAGMLAQLPSEDAEVGLQALVQALSDREPVIRCIAAWWLGVVNSRVDRPQAIPFLVRALADPETVVRDQAAQALATRKQSEVLPAMKAALQDNDQTVRAAAAAALKKMWDEGTKL